jgi:hypothetical protein
MSNLGILWSPRPPSQDGRSTSHGGDQSSRQPLLHSSSPCSSEERTLRSGLATAGNGCEPGHSWGRLRRARNDATSHRQATARSWKSAPRSHPVYPVSSVFKNHGEQLILEANSSSRRVMLVLKHAYGERRRGRARFVRSPAWLDRCYLTRLMTTFATGFLQSYSAGSRSAMP